MPAYIGLKGLVLKFKTGQTRVGTLTQVLTVTRSDPTAISDPVTRDPKTRFQLRSERGDG